MAEAEAEVEVEVEVEYWCHHCDKRVSVESVGADDEPDLICSDCKFGFVESISSSSAAAPVPVVVVDDDDDIDRPTLGAQFLQVLRLLAQVSNDDNPQPPLLPEPPQLPSSDPNDFLRIQIDHLIHRQQHEHDAGDNQDNDDDDDDESVRSVEIEGAADSDTADEDEDEDEEEEEDVLRRQRRDLLRLRLRDFATRARPGTSRNRILDWADILMGLDNNSNSRDPYVGNPGDYVNDAEYEALLQNLADSEGRKGAPPASKAAIQGLKSLQINDEQSSFVCAVCKECVCVGEVVKEMPCAHAYHTDCILPWLAARNTCPVCRFQLPTDDPDYNTTTTSASSALPNSSSSAATF